MRRAAVVSLILIPVGLLSLLGFGVPAHADGSSGNGCSQPTEPPKIERTKPQPASFSPQSQRITMANGERRQVRFTLLRPASPLKPVDVFFLLDATQSMDSAICGVQRDVSGIATDLAKTGLDVQFGLGSFRDYPFQPWGDSTDYVYKLERGIRPLDFNLLDILHNIKATGGADDPESGQAALYQAASGAGQDLNPPGPSKGDVDPGQQADFRAGSLKLIVMVTDAVFVEPPADPKDNYSTEYKGSYPGPPFSLLAQALKDRHILVTSISLSDNARPDLEKVALASGAVAPPGGVSCSGNPKNPDIKEGQPLVCDGSQDGNDGTAVKMGPAIVSIVKAIRESQQITFSVTGDTAILEGALAAGGPTIDLKQAATVPYALNLRCNRFTGLKHLTITSLIKGRPIAAATLDVMCNPPPANAPAVIHLANVAPGAQQPAQPPVSNLNPQVQPGFGMASQAEPQVATQDALDLKDNNNLPMEMTAAHRHRPNGFPLYVVGVAFISGAAAYGLQRQRQHETQQAPAESRKRDR